MVPMKVWIVYLSSFALLVAVIRAPRTLALEPAGRRAPEAAPPPAAVLYIKTYKTASSTLAGLLVRYAAEHNLTAWGGVFAHCRVEAIPAFQVGLRTRSYSPGCTLKDIRTRSRTNTSPYDTKANAAG
jgi:hypothetical protein